MVVSVPADVIVPAEGTVDAERPFTGRRIIAGYAVVLAFLVAAVVISLALGHNEDAKPAIAGSYTSSSACLKAFDIKQSGQYVDLSGPGSIGGKLTLSHGLLKGDATCEDGSTLPLSVAVPGGPPATYSGTL